MDPSEIGVILSVVAILQLLFQVLPLIFKKIAVLGCIFSLQLLVFPQVTKKFEVSSHLQFRSGFGCIMLPCSNRISGRIPIQQFNFSGIGSGMMNTSIPICGPGSIME